MWKTIKNLFKKVLRIKSEDLTEQEEFQTDVSSNQPHSEQAESNSKQADVEEVAPKKAPVETNKREWSFRSNPKYRHKQIDK